jgi:TonB family protein
LRIPLPEPVRELPVANKLDVLPFLKAPEAPALETPVPEFPKPKIPISKIEVKASGFESVKSAAASLSQPRPFRVGDFESASGESVNRHGGVSREGAVLRGLGFATETAVPPILARAATGSGGFGDASVAHASAPKASTLRSNPATTAAEILEKPRPLYTEEARQLGIEGEVLLEVIFEASGETAVVRIVRGLGHGLDEAAIAAAGKIRFRPAQRDGVSVNSPAAVHIVFQLAY